MSAELTGMAAAWLAHASWYLADPGRRARVAPRLTHRQWLSMAGRLGAALFAALATVAWLRAHGGVVGGCCLVAALTAAASVNTIVAPLSPRAVLGLAASSAGLLVIAGLGGLLGT